MNLLKKHWLELQARERLVLGWGSVIVVGILLYALLFQPLYRALAHMESALPGLRSNLVWMRQTDKLIDGGLSSVQVIDGASDSLLSVIESSARRAKVRKAIQKMVPDQKSKEVRVTLEDVEFNSWLIWVDTLYKENGVDITQLTAERDEDKPNIAEIRVTFSRAN